MEMNIKDFSSSLKISSNKDTTITLYTYDVFLEIIRKDLGELRKQEMDKEFEITNSLGNKDKIVIKNKAYFAEQKAMVEKDIRSIIQKKQYIL